jgi:hypothetical protein
MTPPEDVDEYLDAVAPLLHALSVLDDAPGLLAMYWSSEPSSITEVPTSNHSPSADGAELGVEESKSDPPPPVARPRALPPSPRVPLSRRASPARAPRRVLPELVRAHWVEAQQAKQRLTVAETLARRAAQALARARPPVERKPPTGCRPPCRDRADDDSTEPDHPHLVARPPVEGARPMQLVKQRPRLLVWTLMDPPEALNMSQQRMHRPRSRLRSPPLLSTVLRGGVGARSGSCVVGGVSLLPFPPGYNIHPSARSRGPWWGQWFFC